MLNLSRSLTHWLDIPGQVKYRLGMLIYRRQHNKAPRYLMDHCSPVSDVVFRPRLRSTAAVINFPCHATGSAHTGVGRFLLLTPNRLELSAQRPSGSGVFCRHSCSRSTSVSGALEVFTRMRFINFLLTLKLTYNPEWSDWSKRSMDWLIAAVLLCADWCGRWGLIIVCC